MLEQPIEVLCEQIEALLKGYDENVALLTITTYASAIINKMAKSEEHVRLLYDMMADATICLIRAEDDSNQLQAQKDTTKKESTKAKRQKTGNVTGTSSLN